MTISTEQAPPAADGPRTAPRSRAIAHALYACGVGILMCVAVPAAGILTFAGVPGLLLGLVVLLAGSGFAFALTGMGFFGRRSWWLAFTALPWTAAVIAFWLLGLDASGLWGFVLTVSAAGGAVGAACALLAWRGAPRLIGAGILLVVAGVAATGMVLALVPPQEAAGYRGELTTFTTTVPGYLAGEQTSAPGRTTVTYRSGDQVFLLGSEPLDTDPCGTELVAPDGSGETELSCTASAERWYRTSATLQEVAVVRDGWVVRATAAGTVPLGDLENAIALAIPDGAEWISDAPG